MNDFRSFRERRIRRHRDRVRPDCRAHRRRYYSLLLPLSVATSAACLLVSRTSSGGTITDNNLDPTVNDPPVAAAGRTREVVGSLIDTERARTGPFSSALLTVADRQCQVRSPALWPAMPSIRDDSAAVRVSGRMVAFAACSDLLTMKITNKLVLSLVGSFFVVALVAGLPLDALGLARGGGGSHRAGHLASACSRSSWIGGGDAKLMAANLHSGLASASCCPSFFMHRCWGGTLTLAAGRRHGAIRCRFNLKMVPWIDRLHDRKTGVPLRYGARGRCAVRLSDQRGFSASSCLKTYGNIAVNRNRQASINQTLTLYPDSQSTE